MINRLQTWAAERGCRVGWGPLELVETVLKEIGTRRASRELNEVLFQGELASLSVGEGPRERGMTTVVVVVKPRPAHMVSFDLNEDRIEAVLPPTYVRYYPLSDDLERDLQEHGLPGARVERVAAPLKLLAAGLGLVRYGLNNITYVRGIGSYFQLFGYLTNVSLPLPKGWRPRKPSLLPECASCGACLSACPTGAIADDRLLLRAERCLTFANENPGSWPPWVPSWAHHCLVGCLLCQRCCPANPELQLESTGVLFTREETQALLADSGDHSGHQWDGIRAKLDRLGQPYAEPVIGRNLRALVDTSVSRG